MLFTLIATDGWGAELSQVIKAIEQGYDKVTDMQADFTQSSTIAAIKREEKGAGELLVRKVEGASPMFRFNYARPKQQIISNGKKVWYYLPDNKQVMITSLAAVMEGGGSASLHYLTGMANITRDFSVSFVGNGRDKKGNYLLELVPLKKSKTLSKIHLTIDAAMVDSYLENNDAPPRFPVTGSVVFDSSGNRTALEFSNVKVNRGIGSDRFGFKVPAGVEVINPRQ
jgi:outer membrane lipoprotein carrier protein